MRRKPRKSETSLPRESICQRLLPVEANDVGSLKPRTGNLMSGQQHADKSKQLYKFGAKPDPEDRTLVGHSDDRGNWFNLSYEQASALREVTEAYEAPQRAERKHKARRAYRATYYRERRAASTPEQAVERKAKQRAYVSQARADEAPERKEERLEMRRVTDRARRVVVAGQAEARLERNAKRNAKRKAARDYE